MAKKTVFIVEKAVLKALFWVSSIFLSVTSAGCGDEECNGTIYGPPECSSDEECVQTEGEGYYCDKENKMDDGCGDETVWSVCKKKE